MHHVRSFSLALAVAISAAVTDPAAARYSVDGTVLGALMAEYEKFRHGRKGADPEKVGKYLGYIQGVTDVYDYKVCVPAGTDAVALADVVTRYLKAHRDLWSRPALHLVYASIREAYPCP